MGGGRLFDMGASAVKYGTHTHIHKNSNFLVVMISVGLAQTHSYNVHFLKWSCQTRVKDRVSLEFALEMLEERLTIIYDF